MSGTGPAAREHELGDAAAGFWFLPPPRFAVRSQASRFVLDSEEDRGLLLVVPHDAPDRETLVVQLREGWVESGLDLRLQDEPVIEADGSLSATLFGTVQGEASCAALGAVQRRDGPGGVLVLALAAQTDWQPRKYAAYVRMLVLSLRFAPPAPPAPDLVEWREWLADRRLVSLGAAGGRGSAMAGGAFGAWAARRELLLTEDGRFESWGLFGAPGAVLVGRWNLATAETGGAVLDLYADEGGHARIALELREGATLLDGRRFHVTPA